jgi:Mac 1
MCWAAAASNVLTYEKWTTSQYNTGQTVFQYMVDHWTNNAGYMYWAYNWWLNGTKPGTSYAYPDVTGGNFFPTQKASSYEVNASGGNLMATADSLLHKGDGVTMAIRNGSYAHAVTLWGFSQDALGAYTGVYITDSDDGMFGLVNYAIAYQNSAWYLMNGYIAGWYISDLEALAAGASAVPMAPSWVLFGTGVFALYVMRRRPGKGESHSL